MKQKHLLKSLLLLLALMVGSSAWAADYTDVLTASLFKATSTTYTDFTGVSVSNGSSAVYAGNNAKTTSGGIQLRSRNSNSGIVSTTSGGNRVKSVSITVESGSNTLDIYGSNTAYSGASDLYDSSKQGTKVGSLNANGTVTISGDYKYIGLRSNNGAIYLTDVTIVWEAGSSVPTCSLPSFTPAAGSYISAQNVTISTTTEGATIYYTTDGIDPTTSSSIYSSAIPVNETTTIKAIAAKTGYNNSAVATATYTIVSFEHTGTQNDPYTVADARAAIDVNSGVTDVYATGIVSKIVTEYSTQYSNITFDISADGLTTSAQLRAYRCTDESNVDASDVRVGDEVVIKGNLTKYGETYEFAQGCLLISLQHPDVPAVPAINAENVSIAYDATSGEIEYEIENPVEGKSLTATPTADWISNITVGETTVTFTTTVNNGQADRTATITLSYEGAEDKAVTVTQGHYVADFATLPFEFDDGKADIDNTAGLTQSGLGNDYNNSPYLKFDGTGDFVILKINEAPGTLTFDIKGNPGSNGWSGTFTVQTSADGETYTDLETYTSLSTEKQNEKFDNLAENVRYIKWIYTDKESGNVALGNIMLAKYGETPTPQQCTLTVEPFENLEIITFVNDEMVMEEDGDIQVNEGDQIMLSIAALEGYVMETLMVNGVNHVNDIAEDFTYSFEMPAEDVTISATAVEYVAPTPGSWVLTNLADLTEDDVFVIVGDNGDTYALPNNGGTSSAPAAVAVTVVNGTLSGEIADSLQWTLTYGDDGYIFYPNGDNESWLYCANTNNGVRVGTNTNNLFTVENGYLKNEATGRYVGIYNSQDWRCYTNTTGNIVGQTFSFYKKVSAEEESISVSAAGYRTYCSENALDFSAVKGLTAYKATVSDNKVSFVEVTEVPAREGVLLKGAEDTYNVPVIASTTADFTDNEFEGVTEENPNVEAGIYVLLNGDAGVGFYKTKYAFTVGANTAYLPADVAGARSFIAIEEATAIEGIAAETITNGEVYNLQGQRVVKAQKGLYIIDGKKMVVK